MPETVEFELDDELDLLDLTCPGCGADLLEDAGYADWRICSSCNRHFWISARERLQIMQRDAVLTELDYLEPTPGALDRHTRFSPADRQDDVRERSALADALVTGHLTLPGCSAVVAILDPVLMPAGLGIVTAEKLISAVKVAIADQLPMVVFCGGGSLPAGAGLLTGAQPLRVSAAFADLHRTGLPLVALLTHPTAGNVLTAIAINADFRLAETGTETPDDLMPDETIDRPALLKRLADVLHIAGGHDTGSKIQLAESAPGSTLEIRPLGGLTVISLECSTDLAEDQEILAAVRRGKRLAVHLDFPIVFSLTGTTALSMVTQAEIRDRLLQHRRPVIGVLEGMFNLANLTMLACDYFFGRPDLTIAPGARSRPYGSGEILAARLVDDIIEQTAVDPIAESIGASLRLSTARRIERRLRVTVARGAEASDSLEASSRELVDLRELQASLMRSLDDLRQRVEARDFALPSLAQLQERSHLPHLNLPRIQLSRPDLVEVRDRISALRKGTPGSADET